MCSLRHTFFKHKVTVRFVPSSEEEVPVQVDFVEVTLDREVRHRHLKLAAMALLMFTAVLLASVLGLVWGVVAAHKDTKTQVCCRSPPAPLPPPPNLAPVCNMRNAQCPSWQMRRVSRKWCPIGDSWPMKAPPLTRPQPPVPPHRCVQKGMGKRGSCWRVQTCTL